VQTFSRLTLETGYEIITSTATACSSRWIPHIFPPLQPVRAIVENERIDNSMFELKSAELQPIRLYRYCDESTVPLLRKGAF
jgi:hypothetical protein